MKHEISNARYLVKYDTNQRPSRRTTENKLLEGTRVTRVIVKAHEKRKTKANKSTESKQTQLTLEDLKLMVLRVQRQVPRVEDLDPPYNCRSGLAMK